MENSQDAPRNSQKKKLLMTASTFPRWAGDTEPRFVLDLAKSLLPYFDVTVLAPMAPGAAKQEELEGVHVLRYGYFPLEKLQTLCYPGAIVPRIKEKKLRALLVPFMVLSLWGKLLQIRKNYDVIQAHWLIPQGIVQSCFATPPYIVTGHGGDVTGMNKGLMRRLKSHCLRRAAGVTAVSEHLKNILLEIEPKKDVTVISMGCDTSRFGPEHRVENRFEQDGKKVVLFVGRLAEKKGVRYLIEAMKDVDALLVIVGSGPLEAALRAQAAPLGDKVQFLGSKTHAELSEIYASADVFCLPSVTAKNGDQEGMPTVLVEAMASGLPAVASRSSGIADVVQDAENGYLVPPSDAPALAEKLALVLAEDALRTKLRQGALHTAKQYDYTLIGARYADVLQRAADGK